MSNRETISYEGIPLINKPIRAISKIHDNKDRGFILLKVIFTFIVLAELIMEITVDNTVWKHDAVIIKKVQSLFTRKQLKDMYWITYGIEFWTNPYFFSAIILTLYNSFDPFIMAKTSYIFYFMLMIRCVLVVIIFQEPRPFWIDSGVYGVMCDNSYSGPSYRATDSIFLLIYIVRTAYKSKIIGRKAMIVMVSIFSVNSIAVLFFMMAFGLNFFYQIIGGICGNTATDWSGLI